MILEFDIEKAFVKEAARQGCWAIKFKHEGRRDAPDRIVLCPNEIVFFIEFKRPGEQPKIGQLDFMRQLKELGFITYICYSAEEAMDKLRFHLGATDGS